MEKLMALQAEVSPRKVHVVYEPTIPGRVPLNPLFGPRIRTDAWDYSQYQNYLNLLTRQ